MKFFIYARKSTAGIGGGSGIRTHGALRLNGFRDRPVRPLRHPSVHWT